MAHKLTRHHGRGHLHFIAFTRYRRLPLLRSIRARNAFVQILGETRDRYEFSLVGYVVMAEQIQLLISEPAKGTPSTVIQVLKQHVSRRLRRKKRTLPDNFLCHLRAATVRFAASGSGASMILMSGV